MQKKEIKMSKITFKGSPVVTAGELPAVGSKAPDFRLVGADLSEKTLENYAGKKKILTVNPSYDTGVCQKTAREFNQRMSARDDVVVLAVSGDLPFAQKRFCEAESLSNVEALSCFRSSFGEDYGLTMVDGPLQGLTARAVLVLDETNTVKHRQLVPEIVQEPNYDEVIAAL